MQSVVSAACGSLLAESTYLSSAQPIRALPKLAWTGSLAFFSPLTPIPAFVSLLSPLAYIDLFASVVSVGSIRRTLAPPSLSPRNPVQRSTSLIGGDYFRPTWLTVPPRRSSLRSSNHSRQHRRVTRCVFTMNVCYGQGSYKFR